MSQYTAYRTPNKHLMKLFLYDPDRYKSVILTPRQVKILEMMKIWRYPTFTASDLSKYAKISIQSASIQMSTLWKTGYIQRREVEQASGGYEYHYQINKDLVK